MGKAPCCDKANVKKGPWSPEEDAKLKAYIEVHGTGGNWIALPHKIGLKRCGKSCRLRWLNYLRPNIKHGGFSEEEDQIICSLYISIGSRWSIIAAQLPGRTDNDIKNYWNTKLKKKLFGRCQEKPNFRRLSTDEDRNVPKAVGISQASLERMQLHMQLQGFNNPFSLYYSKPLEDSMLQGQYNDTVSEIPMQQACDTASMSIDREGANSVSASMLGEFQNLQNPGVGSEQSNSNFNLAVAGPQAEFYDLLYWKNIDCSMVQDDNQPGELGCFKEVNSLWSNNGVEEKSSLSSQDSDYLVI